MNIDQAKRAAAEAAIPFIEQGDVVGVGTGSTVHWFIEALARLGDRIDGAVSSSEQTSAKLKAAGIRVLDLNSTGDLPLYVDGADEVDPHRRLIKGGGGALTREKIIAAASRRFICIADASKRVDRLGKFPLPIEVIPMARSYVARQIVKLGGHPALREGPPSDNGNPILDVHHLDLSDPVRMEATLNQLAGVVSCGLFAARPADLVLLAGADGVQQV